MLERLERLPDGRYSYRTKYTRNGRTHRVMSGTELIARIAALVPPPRYPLVRYHGCFAPAHIWRRSVVPKPPPRRAAACTRSSQSTEQTATAPEHAAVPTPTHADTDRRLERSELRSRFVLSDPHLARLLDGLLVMSTPRADWATLLRRSHHLDVLDCPRSSPRSLMSYLGVTPSEYSSGSKRQRGSTGRRHRCAAASLLDCLPRSVGTLRHAPIGHDQRAVG